MEDRVKRFLSGADWRSLWAPVAKKPPPFRINIRQIQLDAARSPTSASHMSPLSPATAKLKMIQLKKAKIQAIRRRIGELATPKSYSQDNSEDDCMVGPADYDTRLELGRPCYLSNRPTNPAFSMNKLTPRPVLAKQTTRLPLSIRTHAEKKSNIRSFSIPRVRQHSLTRSPKRHRTEWKESLRREISLSDTRDYTPTPLPSYRGQYSIPKANRRLNIRKCKRWIGSVGGEPEVQ